MQIVKLGEQLNCPLVVCLGFFGCMHKGHEELLNRAKLSAQAINGKVALFTFSNNHLAVLNRDSTVLYTYEERLTIYDSLGVDYVITAAFDNHFKRLTARQFLSQFAQYDVQSVFCGFDHCCGSDRLSAMGIRQFFKDVNDIPVHIVEQISVDDEKISTSLLKRYLANNQIDNVNALLSEPFFLIGNVVHGRGVGKTLGFPTANIAVSAEKLLPRGVFSAKVYFDGQRYPAIVNIGNTPTFEIARNAVEAHIIGLDDDLYGKTVKVSLVKYLRPITKFQSSKKLSEQLQHDKEAALHD